MNEIGAKMTEVLTSAQMRAIEAAAIASGEVTGLELMERAGRGVLEAIFEAWPKLKATSHRAVVLCGPGNNGGDGFVVARLLKERGWKVEVFLHGDPERLPPDARVNYERWQGMGAVLSYDARSLLQKGAEAVLAGVDRWLVVDALFGIGQRAPLDGILEPVNALIDATFEERAAPTPFFVAVDVPTGYNADTGSPLARRPMPADLIVTFHARKPLHTLPQMADVRCITVDIGL
jgi:hydroxyethylthiazole kinase-like uncharacterized protein yjeF